MVVASPQSIRGYQIGQAAQRSGVTAVNIRFYEKEKLIPARGMGASSYRMYSDEDVHQLRFIRLLRSLDMSLDEVRTLLHLDLRKKSHCQTARDTLDAHIDHVRTRLKELRSLEKDLNALRGQCDGQNEQCHLIEALHARAYKDVTSAATSKLRTHL
jgi:DNA-binding transcriptional MerR regulator